MKILKKTESGFAQLVVLGVMALMAVALPLTTNLVKQNQENRSKAAEETNTSLSPVLYFGQVKSNYSIGETFSMIIGVDSAFRKISGVDIVGTYDSSKLELISMKKASGFVFDGIGSCSLPTGLAGKFAGTCYVEDSRNEKEVNGELIVLNFLTKSNGSAQISLNCNEGDTLDSNIVSDSKDIIDCKKTIQHLSFGIGQTILTTPTPIKTTPECGISGTYTETPKTENLCKVGNPDSVKVNRTTMVYTWKCVVGNETKGCSARPNNGGVGILRITPAISTGSACVSKEGVNTFSVDTECDSGKFRYMTFICYDGYTRREGGPTSCKSSDLWRTYADGYCKGHFNSCSTQTSSVSVSGRCGDSRNVCITGNVDENTLVDTESDYKWKCLGSNGGKNVNCSLSKKIEGKCGSKRNTCISGSASVMTSSSTLYRWRCVGRYGGKTVSCSVRK